MGKLLSVVVGLSLVVSARAADGPGVTTEFKLQIHGYGLEKDPITRDEIVCQDGLISHFSFESKEVVRIDLVKERVEILDLERKVRTDLTFRQLDEGLSKVKTSLRSVIDDLKAKGGRGNRIEAEMTGHLLEPKFATTFDPKANQVRLVNPSVEVDASGEPEKDTARLALIGRTLSIIARIGSFRAPNDLPPFVELDAITALTADQKLRPTEISYLYRLTGPPRRFRRTYRLIPTLTDRDREALARIDRFRDLTPIVKYDRYRVR